MSGGWSEESQLRVKFVTKYDIYRIPETPFVLPAHLHPAGLSEVIKHLLNGAVEGVSLDNVTFDFSIGDVYLRSSLYKFVTARRLSTEETIVIEYFPSVLLSSDDSLFTELPSWVGSLDIDETSGLAGCYDGQVKIFDPQNLSVIHTLQCHEEPIRQLLSLHHRHCFATASKDCTVKVWRRKDMRLQTTLTGHINSVESLALWSPTEQEEPLLLSGDWSGNLFAWKIPDALYRDDTDTAVNHDDDHIQKKRKGSKSSATAAKHSHQELSTTNVKALFKVKAHGQSISSILTQPTISPNRSAAVVYTSSWEQAIKVWDLNRQDCLTTFNAGKVITSMDCSSGNKSLLASSHPDGKIRVWDGNNKETTSSASLTLGSLKNTSWISHVAWQPNSDNLLASVDYNGKLCLWDLRSTVPLSSQDVHNGKALTLQWLKDAKLDKYRIISGGSDCCLRSTLVSC